MFMVARAEHTFASTVPADDYPEWDSLTVYALGSRVITAATDQVWQSVSDSNSGHDPTSDTGANWALVGATDRAKPFDTALGEVVTRTGDMEWTLTLATRANTLALFGVGATEIRVRVILSGSTLYDETRSVVDTSGIADWWDYFTWQPKFDTEVLFHDLPGYAGAQIVVTLSSGGGSTSISEIYCGWANAIGTSLVDSRLNIRSYSTKSRDQYGVVKIVRRQSSRGMTYQVAMALEDVRRVSRILQANLDVPCVFFVSKDLATVPYGATVLGFLSDFDIPLTHGRSFATLEVEGMI